MFDQMHLSQEVSADFQRSLVGREMEDASPLALFQARVIVLVSLLLEDGEAFMEYLAQSRQEETEVKAQLQRVTDEFKHRLSRSTQDNLLLRDHLQQSDEEEHGSDARLGPKSQS
ncbi:Hypothetical predicted protein [Lecanosticta acicola]|uniref:Uncharacterized protein n=1 Tax=Lecanosticta acicola TaxID=111012 RepID=A0AAI8YRF8_9PEZI|nr:Hypothetical predicted protein [Lecanosticta acicola]